MLPRSPRVAAAVSLRSYLAQVGGVISIGAQVQIRNNQASANGGGVYCSSFSEGDGTPVSLLVEGQAEISSNQAASGGGVYFYSANQGDRLALTGPIRIAGNTVTGNGGGVYLSAPRDSVLLSVQGPSIADNHAANGGGLYLRTTAGGTLEVTGRATLSGNEAAGAASSAGGGLWIQNVSGTLDATFSNASLLANQAASNGGGLFLSNSGSVSLGATGGAISRNTAGASGGGVYLTGTDGATGTLVPPGKGPQGIATPYPVAPGLACPRRQGNGSRRLICFHEPLEHLGKFGAGSPGLGGQRSGAALQKPGAHGPLHRLLRPCGYVPAVCVNSQFVPLGNVPFLKLRVAVKDDRKLFTGDGIARAIGGSVIAVYQPSSRRPGDAGGIPLAGPHIGKGILRCDNRGTLQAVEHHRGLARVTAPRGSNVLGPVPLIRPF